MSRVSLKEREREMLFALVCDNLLYLNDCLRQSEDDGASSEEIADLRTAIEHADALADKLARARRAGTL